MSGFQSVPDRRPRHRLAPHRRLYRGVSILRRQQGREAGRGNGRDCRGAELSRGALRFSGAFRSRRRKSGAASPATMACWTSGRRFIGCATTSRGSGAILRRSRWPVHQPEARVSASISSRRRVRGSSIGRLFRALYPTSRWRSALEGEAQGDAFAAALGCLDPSTVVACMRSKSRDAVLTALTPATQQVVEPPNRTFWEPVVDGVVIPDQPRTLMEMGAFHRVPTIVGFNRDEGWGAFITRSFPSG